MPFSDLIPYQSDVLLKFVNLAKERNLTPPEFTAFLLTDGVLISASSLEPLSEESTVWGALNVLADRGYIDVTFEETGHNRFNFALSPRAFRYYEWVRKPILRRRLSIWWIELPDKGRMIVAAVVGAIIPLVIVGIWNLLLWILH